MIASKRRDGKFIHCDYKADMQQIIIARVLFVVWLACMWCTPLDIAFRVNKEYNILSHDLTARQSSIMELGLRF